MTDQQPTPRFDLYRFIHKGMRAYMCDVLTAVGRMDTEDDKDVRYVLDHVRQLLAFCVEHLNHENHLVHTAMESRDPSSSGKIAAEHIDHRMACQGLAAEVVMVETAQGQAREAAALQLYHRLSHFVAENFVHMLVEEREHNAVLWRHFSDDELRAIEHAIVSSLTPEESLTTMRWILPAATPRERIQLMREIQAGAPAEVFTALLSAVQPHLTQKEYAKLTSGLTAAQVTAAA